MEYPLLSSAFLISIDCMDISFANDFKLFNPEEVQSNYKNENNLPYFQWILINNFRKKKKLSQNL